LGLSSSVILVGELADIKLAMLPIIATAGGMLVPVLIYLSINPEGRAINGPVARPYGKTGVNHFK